MKVNVQRIADLNIITNLDTGILTMRIEIGGDLIDVPLSGEQAAALVAQIRQGTEMLNLFRVSRPSAKVTSPKSKETAGAKVEPPPPEKETRRREPRRRRGPYKLRARSESEILALRGQTSEAPETNHE